MPEADEILAHIQGQSSSLSGGGPSFGFGGGQSSSTLAFSGGANNRLGSSTPSSATSASIGGLPVQESFKIPDSFMIANDSGGNNGSGAVSSPFSRGRMWSSMSNRNGNSANFDLSRDSIEEDNFEPGSSMLSSTRRSNTGRSGVASGSGIGNSAGNNMMSDIDNFNPWG